MEQAHRPVLQVLSESGLASSETVEKAQSWFANRLKQEAVEEEIGHTLPKGKKRKKKCLH